MNQKTIILSVVIFALLIAGMFMFANFKKAEITAPEPIAEEEVDESAVPYPNITRIDAKHFFIDGVHTVAGEVNMPTPCDLLEANATVMESFPEQVIIDFSVINTAEMCAQVVTPQRFMVEFSASEEADIRALFMGRDVELNLVPAAEGETPDEFELFIKG